MKDTLSHSKSRGLRLSEIVLHKKRHGGQWKIKLKSHSPLTLAKR